MDGAYCSADGITYAANVFQKLPALLLAERRRCLRCLGDGCGQPAFFRSRSRDGRAACFGSYEHTQDCPFSTIGPQDVGCGHDAPSPEFANLGDHLFIDVQPDALQHPHHDPDDEDPSRPTPRHGAPYGEDGPRPAASHKRLRPILKELLRSFAFRRSNPIVHFEEFEPRPAHDFFRRFLDVTVRVDAHQSRGYWGTLVSANFDDGSLWLNAGIPGQFSVLVKREDLPQFWYSVGMSRPEDLAGAALIVLGTCTISARSKPYLRLPPPSRWALLNAESAGMAVERRT